MTPSNLVIFQQICLLIGVHIIADAVFQSREMGKNKSKVLKWWALHILIIYAAFTPFGLKFAAINATVHGAIDVVIWRLYGALVLELEDKPCGYRFDINVRKPFIEQLRKSYEYWEDPKFYLFIIIDQMLHILTLIGLYLAGV